MGLKASGNSSHQYWSNNVSILLCEGPKTQNSMIWGFLDVSRPPKPVLFIFRDTKTPRKIQEESNTILKNVILGNLKRLQIDVWKCWKRRVSIIPTIHLISSWKILNMAPISSPNNVKLKFVRILNMGSVSFESHEMVIWYWIWDHHFQKTWIGNLVISIRWT